MRPTASWQTLLDFAQPDRSMEPEREGDVRDSLADISAAREALGYVPAGFVRGRAAPYGRLVSREF